VVNIAKLEQPLEATVASYVKTLREAKITEDGDLQIVQGNWKPKALLRFIILSLFVILCYFMFQFYLPGQRGGFAIIATAVLIGKKFLDNLIGR